MDGHFIAQLPSWIVTAIIGLVGVGIGWGFFKSEISHIKEDQVNQKIRIESLIAHCETFRGQCTLTMADKFEEIKTSVNKSRDITTEQFAEIKEWMGYVKRVIEVMNGKNKIGV